MNDFTSCLCITWRFLDWTISHTCSKPARPDSWIECLLALCISASPLTDTEPGRMTRCTGELCRVAEFSFVFTRNIPWVVVCFYSITRCGSFHGVTIAEQTKSYPKRFTLIRCPWFSPVYFLAFLFADMALRCCGLSNGLPRRNWGGGGVP